MFFLLIRKAEIFITKLQKNENEDVTEEFETTENDGTDDEKVLEQGYDVN